MFEDIGFKILHCSNRKKSFRYSKENLTSKITVSLNEKNVYFFREDYIN